MPSRDGGPSGGRTGSACDESRAARKARLTRIVRRAMERVRLDKWLWAARFFKTRGAATDAVLGGRVHVNRVRVKPARLLSVGDVVELTINSQRRTVQV